MRTERVADFGAREAAAGAAWQLHGQLRAWLVNAAYPLWARAGYDPVHGGFHERLASDGPVAGDARRARVQLRQVYAFANAPALGWTGDPVPLVCGGLEFLFAHYRRADGLLRTLCASDGTALDERAFLYDQAFVLLALAESQKVLGPRGDLVQEARVLMETIERLLKGSGAGFASGLPERLPRLSNPHMHLLEAALAWREISAAPVWGRLVEGLVELALTRLIAARNGALLEHSGEDWLPLPGAEGHIVQPGHLFEWAWLLQRCGSERAAAAALRLVRLAERHGVRGGVALNALLDDFSVHDAQARLWPQAERLKALARLAATDGDYWADVVGSGRTLQRYLAVLPEGLWYATLTVNGRFIAEPSPASTLYHLVAAIVQLGGALAVATGSPATR